MSRFLTRRAWLSSPTIRGRSSREMGLHFRENLWHGTVVQWRVIVAVPGYTALMLSFAQLLHALMRLAAAHETSPAFNAKLTYKYDRLVKINTLAFIASLKSTRSESGVAQYPWQYIKPWNATRWPTYVVDDEIQSVVLVR